MGQPNTQYASAGDVNIAYQVIGEGPVDLVWSYGLASNLDVFWEEPSLAAFFRRLAEFSRLIVFDRRGCGLSDRGGALTTPTLEERADDILAVLDAVGSERASIFGVSEGGGLAALFASTHPERTTSIVAYGTLVPIKGIEHPLGFHDESIAVVTAETWARGWGTFEAAAATVPTWATSMAGDPQFTAWMARYMRQSVSRNEIRPLLINTFNYDLTDVFPAVRVPALVLSRRNDPLVPPSYGRHIASMIPDARFVELDGVDHLPFLGDAESVAGEIEEFLVGSRADKPRTRRLVTLVLTEIGEPAPLLADRGDGAWRELLAAHDRDVRGHLGRFGGQEVKHSGSGFLAAFDGPARAIGCALGILDAVERRGLSLRVAAHTGECEWADGELGGVPLLVGARLLESAAPGEILVSGTVRDLVAGSGIRFGESRDIELTGIIGRRTVFPVIRHGVTPDVARRLAGDQANVFRLDGEYWTVGFRGLVVTLRDSKGLRDISRLLVEPDREFHVLDLAVEGSPSRGIPKNEAVAAELRAPSSAAPVIDERARAQYKRRITQLESEIADAEARGHGDGSAREELEAVVEALASAYGLGGTVRRTPDDVERARKAVTRRIRDAIERVDRAHPPLGRHLQASIHTGVFCRYAPERDTEWRVEA